MSIYKRELKTITAFLSLDYDNIENVLNEEKFCNYRFIEIASKNLKINMKKSAEYLKELQNKYNWDKKFGDLDVLEYSEEKDNITFKDTFSYEEIKSLIYFIKEDIRNGMKYKLENLI